MLRIIRNTVLAKMSMLVVTGRFIIVGAIGFFVNYASLQLFSGVLGLNKITGEIIATAVALQITFLLNDSWTYRTKGIHYTFNLRKRYLSYIASNAAGSLATILAFSLLHTRISSDLLALMLAAVVGTTWNYFANLFLVWKQDTADTAAEE